MNACQAHQEQLLDLLYGLLDQPEEQSLRAHLVGCPGCRQALTQAQAQQKLLAAAARKEFPEVSFAPPVEETPAPGPDVVRLPDRGTGPGRGWRRWVVGWAAAACVLLALGGLALPARQARQEHETARLAVEAQQQELDRTRQQMERAEKMLALAARIRDNKVAEVREEQQQRQLRMVVSGPRRVQAGAATDFLVRTTGPDGKPAEADLQISVDAPRPREAEGKGEKADAKGDGGKEGGASKKVLEDARPRVEVLSKGVYKVQLPPTLPMAAGRVLSMSVTAWRKGARRDEDGRKPLSLRGAVQLSGPVFVTHLTTDRPRYQPGDVVRFRSLTLDRATLTPPALPLQLRYLLTQPAGATSEVAAGASVLRRHDGATNRNHEVNGPDGKPLAGVGAGEAALAPNAPAGEYLLTVLEESGRFQPVSRRFVVSEPRPTRLEKKLELDRASYGPGEQVGVLAKARRLDGLQMAECPVEGSLYVDGARAATASGKLNQMGEAKLGFKLPPWMARGVGAVEVKFKAAGATETATKEVPVALGRLELEFFPEGGDLVAGLPNRVYFQARTPAGKPAQMSGTLLEDGEPTPVRAETMSDSREPGVNQGLGSFTFTPKEGKTYRLRVDRPRGIGNPVLLPRVRADGVVLSVPKGVFYPSELIVAHVRSSRPRTLLVGAYCRDTLVGAAQLEPGETRAELRSDSPVGGVCRITVFEVVPSGAEQKQLRPVAERLVYRHPGKRVDVSVLAKGKTFTAGERVTLGLLATDEKERPVPAVVQMSVVDQAAVADAGKAQSMPTYFLLSTEVRRAEDLENADFLIGQHPKAPAVLDHLLGTQGWRRFAEQATAEFRSRLRKAAEGLPERERLRREAEAQRLLMLMGQSAPVRTDFDEQRAEKAKKEFASEAAGLLKKHAEARQAYQKAAEDPVYVEALEALRRDDELWRQGREVALPLLGGLAILLAGFAAWRLWQNERPWASGLLALACCAGLVAAWHCPEGLSVPEEPEVAEAKELAAPKLPQKGEDKAPVEEKQLGSGDEELLAAEGTGGEERKPAGKDTNLASRGTAKGLGTGKEPGGGGPGFGAGGGFGMLPQASSGRRPLALMRPGDKSGRFKDPRFARPLPGGAVPPGVGFGGAYGGPALGGRGGVFGKGETTYSSYSPLVFREYAHVKPASSPTVLAADQPETLYWHPVLVLPNGKGEATFQLPDTAARFKASVFAHTLDGRLGAKTHVIESRPAANRPAKAPRK